MPNVPSPKRASLTTFAGVALAGSTGSIGAIPMVAQPQLAPINQVSLHSSHRADGGTRTKQLPHRQKAGRKCPDTAKSLRASRRNSGLQTR